jgi:integrase
VEIGEYHPGWKTVKRRRTRVIAARSEIGRNLRWQASAIQRFVDLGGTKGLPAPKPAIASRKKTVDTKRQGWEYLRNETGYTATDVSEVATTITLNEYAQRWLKQMNAAVKPQTMLRYESILRTHVLPEIGAIKMVDLNRSTVKNWLIAKQSVKSKSTAHHCYRVLHVIFEEALDDRLLRANPISRLGRKLKLATKSEEKHKAFTAPELTKFLETIDAYFPESSALFSTLAWTGGRIGEVQALQWSNLDWSAKQLRVEGNMTRAGDTGTPKSRAGYRAIDLPSPLVDTLRQLKNKMDEQALETGKEPTGIFFDGYNATASTVQKWLYKVNKQFKTALKLADVKESMTVHGLRHTYASLMLQRGCPIQWVQQQLGHSTIGMTVDLYGRHLPKQSPAGTLDNLVNQVAPRKSGSKTVASGTLVAYPANRINDLREIRGSLVSSGTPARFPISRNSWGFMTSGSSARTCSIRART